MLFWVEWWHRVRHWLSVDWAGCSQFFSVFDPDVLETVNINRLWGCHRHQLGATKVEIFAALCP